MKRSQPLLLAFVAAVLAAAEVAAADRTVAERFVRLVPLEANGGLRVENPYGSIEVTGSDQPGMQIMIVKTIRGGSDQALAAGRQLTQSLLAGDAANRLVRTVVPSAKGQSWSGKIDYAIRVPRTADLVVLSHSAERIRVTGMRGNVKIKNFSGPITVTGLTGPVDVDTVNGSIYANFDKTPHSTSEFRSVNGIIEVRVPQNAFFNWIAETLQGDILSAMPVRVFKSIKDKSFQAVVNRGSGPRVLTSSLTGRVFLLPGNSSRADARSIRSARPPDQRVAARSQETSDALQSMVGRVLLDAPSASRFAVQHNSYNGDFFFRTNLGNIFVGEVRGEADIQTEAGEIVLGTVHGGCDAVSGGGPLNFGDILGLLNAKTSAGNVMVRAARKGGNASTQGGNVEILYSGGPMRVYSGGGDITLRQAADDVHAETKSGDISLAFDPSIRTARVEAWASGGNVIINLPPRFGADIDAEVTTDDDGTHIFSDIPGLSIVRSRVGNRTVVRATGKVNGGGKRVEIRATGGDIHLRTRTLPRIVMVEPK